MDKYSLSIMSSFLLLVACETQVHERAGYSSSSLFRASWPIESFDGFDPYPPGASGQIRSFVSFGTGDGILRFSLGCGRYSMPYAIYEEGIIELPEDGEIVRPDLDRLGCSDEIKVLSEDLANFLGNSPRVENIGAQVLTLKGQGRILELASVEYVLRD